MNSWSLERQVEDFTASGRLPGRSVACDRADFYCGHARKSQSIIAVANLKMGDVALTSAGPEVKGVAASSDAASGLGRLRVLACAYACNPFRGSEEAVGWNWVRAVAARCEVTVITAAFHRDDIERARATTDSWARSVRFEYVPHRPWHYAPTPLWLRVESSLLKPLMNHAYRLWLGDAFTLAKELAQSQRFGLVHQLTYVGYRFPGHLWRLGLPFVWGPLGGLEIVRWRLLRAMDASGIVYYAAHNLVNSLHRRFLREPRRALGAAGPGVIAATTGIRTELRRWYGADSTVICEVTAPEPREGDPAPRGDDQPLHLAWSGQHTSGKALPLLLRALRDLPADVGWRLFIYGSGTKTGYWKRLANRLGVDGGCVWIGHIPREQAIAGLADAHLFVITSLKDLTSTVLLEALSQQVPVICPDHCGFSDVVTAECGIKLAIDTPVAFVAGLRGAITELFRDEPRRRQLGVGAGVRARTFGLDAKAAHVHAVYERVLSWEPEPPR